MRDYRVKCVDSHCMWSPRTKPFDESIDLLTKHREATGHPINLKPVVSADE